VMMGGALRRAFPVPRNERNGVIKLKVPSRFSAGKRMI